METTAILSKRNERRTTTSEPESILLGAGHADSGAAVPDEAVEVIDTPGAPVAQPQGDGPLPTNSTIMDDRGMVPGEGDGPIPGKLPDSIDPAVNVRLDRGQVETHVKEAFRVATLDHDMHGAGKVATAISWIGKYLLEYRPTYKEVADLLVGDLPGEAGKVTTILQSVREGYGPDSLPVKGKDAMARVEVGKPENSYRQRATRYVFLARVYIGRVDKEDSPHPVSVKINGVDYIDPVDAMTGSRGTKRVCSFSSVYHAWHNIVRPATVDLTRFMDETKAREAAKAAVLDDKTTPRVTVRAFDPKIKGERKVAIQAVKMKDTLLGTIEGLLIAGTDRYGFTVAQVTRFSKLAGYKLEPGALAPIERKKSEEAE